MQKARRLFILIVIKFHFTEKLNKLIIVIIITFVIIISIIA